MNLSAWSIKKPLPTIVMFLVLSIVGLMSFQQLGIDNNPNIDVPVVSVTVRQPGAGPTELETQVTKKIEDAVAGLGNIDELTSTVTDGNSTTRINFVLGTNSDRATNDVRNAIAQIRQSLPQDINDPIVQREEFSGGPIMTYAVFSESRSVEELSDLVDRNIGRAILDIPGVAQVQRVGGLDREIQVNLNPDRLQALGITATQVNDQIRAFNVDLPGGRSEVGGTEKTIRTLGSAASVEILKNYQIILPNNSSVSLASIGEVVDSHATPRQLAKLLVNQGERATQLETKQKTQPVVGFQVFRSTGSTLVTVEEAVRAAVKNLEKTLPKDIKLELIFTRATNIRESYEASIDSLFEACALAVLTILLFLRNWRPTLITAISLPLSILPTYIVMKMLGYTLNGMTLLALALTVGNLVDDTVVEVENIDQHLTMGKNSHQAALDSSEEIGLAVLASAGTIIGVFLPVAFMGGVPGQFFQPFAVTVAVSTVFSTLVARTMTPLLGSRLMKKSPPKPKKLGKKGRSIVPDQWLIHPYQSLLSWALKHRLVTLAIALLFFWGSLQLVPLIPKGLFNSGDTGLSTISIELAPGSTLAETEQTVQQALDILGKEPIVVNAFASMGGSNQNSGVNIASITANLTPRQTRSVTQQQFEQKIRQEFQKIPGARISIGGGGAGGTRKDLTLILKSENAEALNTVSNNLEKQMRDIQGIVEVSSTASLVKPEILIKPDPNRAADLGVSVQAIARTASLATLGDNESNLAKFNLADRQIPIRVKLGEEFRNNLEILQNLQIPNQRGGLVPLSAVAQIMIGSGPAEIKRFDRLRQVTLDANLEGISLGDVVEKVRNLPAINPLPAGVFTQPAGDAKIMRDIFSRFLGALAFGVLSIYGVLVLLYNSFLTPLAILVALPLSIGGALAGLMIAQKELGLFALIGIVLLMGLVTKNAILLVDCAIANEAAGMPQFKAVLDSGMSRLRPIMMTSVSTIAGMIPLALGIGAGSQTRAPMAIAVIGGFTTSTLLTLVVVPVLYTYVDAWQRWLINKFSNWSWPKKLRFFPFSLNKAKNKIY